jgi:hypothetical protein
MRPSNDHAESLEALRGRYESLNRQKITAEANLKTTTDNLEKLKKEARERYGTDELTSLRAKLEEMKQENKRRLTQYQEHLAEIERQLTEVESRHDEAAGRGPQA